MGSDPIFLYDFDPIFLALKRLVFFDLAPFPLPPLHETLTTVAAVYLGATFEGR